MAVDQKYKALPSWHMEVFSLAPDRSLVVMNKKIDPDISGHPNDNGHKYDQRAYDGNKGSDKGGANEQIGDQKSGHGKGYSNGIAYIHGPIKKRRFYLVFCATLRTAFAHLKKSPHMVGILILIHALLMTFGTTSC